MIRKRRKREIDPADPWKGPLIDEDDYEAVKAEPTRLNTEADLRPKKPFDMSMLAARPSISPPQERSPADDLRGRIEAIGSKQYGPGGKDRDPKWSLGEKIGSFILGMFDGTGGVNAAMDRNYLEKRQDRQELAQLTPAYSRLQQMTEDDLSNQRQVLQNQHSALRPLLDMEKVSIQQQNADVRANYYEGLLADKARGRELSERQITDLDDYRKELIRQGDERSILTARRIEETIRHNRATEGQQVRNEVGRNARAGMAEQGRMSRAQMQSEVRRELEVFKAAERTKNVEAMNAARERLARLRAELGN